LGRSVRRGFVGNYTWTLENVLIAAACMLLSGPLLGYTQTLNDFYDRDIDAINEPTAPFLWSNFGSQVVTQIIVLLLAALAWHLP